MRCGRWFGSLRMRVVSPGKTPKADQNGPARAQAIHLALQIVIQFFDRHQRETGFAIFDKILLIH